MSAKPAKKKSSPAPAASSVAAPSAMLPAPVAVTTAATLEATTPWIESADPRKRLYGKIAFGVILLYVAALWLLALDQMLDLGIFGP